MKKYLAIAIAGVALLGACKDSTAVPDLNNPSLGDLTTKPLTKIGLQNEITGYHDAQRASLGVAPANYIVFGEVMARDAYRIDASEARYVNEFLNGTPDPSAFSGAGNFTAFFRGIRAANTILQILPSIPAAEGVTDQQKTAISGMVRTMKAIDYYKALEYRDTLGIPIAVEPPLGSALGPIVCKQKVLDYISSLLDSANTQLAAGGSSFGVELPPGFAGFNTPATFALFNRGWKGKVELYRALDHAAPTGAAGFTAAIAAINASFINTTDASQISKGVYFTFSTSPGDTPNQLVDGNLHLNPQVSDSLQPGDKRGAKIITVPTTTSQSLTYKSNFKVTQTDPIAYLKNEELILLRAQAKVGLGDLVGALADVNFVRLAAGGLAPLPPFTSATQAIDAILREKRYSLLFESAHRLVDLRAYGRLNATFFKKERTGDIFLKALPIPQNESDQRGGNITPVCT
ncbi:MAG: RagB/SusD family nutrient uptake outer membrane protein [Gemmatimonadaceae bacterium]|nr:RagB/SusD family nutrient uptake outer membrane protein [Gemmatimonadaceae bacterium]